MIIQPNLFYNKNNFALYLRYYYPSIDEYKFNSSIYLSTFCHLYSLIISI